MTPADQDFMDFPVQNLRDVLLVTVIRGDQLGQFATQSQGIALVSLQQKEDTAELVKMDILDCQHKDAWLAGVTMLVQTQVRYFTDTLRYRV